jgi:hypothetical protein
VEIAAGMQAKWTLAVQTDGRSIDILQTIARIERSAANVL